MIFAGSGLMYVENVDGSLILRTRHLAGHQFEFGCPSDLLMPLMILSGDFEIGPCRSGDANPFHYIVTKYVDNHRGWDGLYSSPFGCNEDIPQRSHNAVLFPPAKRALQTY